MARRRNFTSALAARHDMVPARGHGPLAKDTDVIHGIDGVRFIENGSGAKANSHGPISFWAGQRGEAPFSWSENSG